MPMISQRALEMQHDVDPKKAILEELEGRIEELAKAKMSSSKILVAVYERPEKTASGLYVPPSARDEDRHQGKVGLVLKKGRLAFKNDANHSWDAEDVPEVGDWVVFNVNRTTPLLIGKRMCRFVEDVYVDLVIENPDLVY